MLETIINILRLPEDEKFKEILDKYPKTAEVILQERHQFEKSISPELGEYNFQKKSESYTKARIEFWYKVTILRNVYRTHLGYN